MSTQKNKTNGGDVQPIKVPRHLLARVVKVIQIGALLPDVARHAPDFDLTPFVNGCNQILGELLRLTHKVAELEQATDREVPDAE